eukprot:8696550-Heterocapsa_arctica.AAC.1
MLIEKVLLHGGGEQEVFATIQQFDILTRQEEALYAEAVEAVKTKEIGSFKVNDVYREVPASQADGFRKIQTLW